MPKFSTLRRNAAACVSHAAALILRRREYQKHGHARYDRAGVAREKRLGAALALLFIFTLVEATGGVWSNSIALLAESAHMLADSASLLLVIVAIRLGRKVADADRTYRSQRYELLAAFANGLTLLVLTGWIVVEAARRLVVPPEINGHVMLGVALMGGVANLEAFMPLSGAKSLNERGVRAHILSDLLGSGAAAAAACVVLLFGWLPVDPLLSSAVSVLVFRSGWHLIRESGHILLEGTPRGFNIKQLETQLQGIAGVSEIHHVHIWSPTGGSPMVTLCARIVDVADRAQALEAILSRLEELGVRHAALQMEHK